MKIVKVYYLPSPYLSVHICQLCYHRTEFHENLCWVVLLKFDSTLQFLVKLDNITRGVG
jgi:hypothetical protein